MQRSVILCASVLFIISLAPAAEAQWPTYFDGKLVVSINGGAQPGAGDLDRQSGFPLYDETAQFENNQDLSGGGFFEIGGSYRVRGLLGVGISFTSLGSSNDAALTGSLPHPVVRGRPRSFTAAATGLDHKERAVHLNAIWSMPFTDKVDFNFSLGPSFFSVKQDFVRNFSFEEAPDFNAVAITGVDVARLSEWAVGVNIGAEATYILTRNISGAALLRFTRGTAGFDIDETQSADVKAGNVQLAFGVRLKL
jgi:hypothetical protein